MIIILNFLLLGGRRGENISLEKILSFVTGIDEEPLLGFEMDPSIQFINNQNGFIPTSSTCINQLKLPVPSIQNPLINEQSLFRMYDYAFSNKYFGLA